MNSPSEVSAGSSSGRGSYALATPGSHAMAALPIAGGMVTPFEFRLLTGEDSPAAGAASTSQASGSGAEDVLARAGYDTVRQEGFDQGEREGRRAARGEMEPEMRASLARERERLVDTVAQFRTGRQRYFAEVEQEVVKLALAIAERILHREAQIDPLLLTGVVRVALERMADRSGVVLHAAGEDVAAWEQVFHSTEESGRPRVVEDVRLERGECVLETKMGTIELGVSVQLEEIEKGFFDLLNHRPVS
jgi:flagellar assembly protein FliH